MLNFIIDLATSLPAVIATGGAGAIGTIATALGLVPGPWGLLVRVAVRAAICACFFIVGFRAADDRAATQARIERLEGDNAKLQAQLDNQKLVAEFASAERIWLIDAKADADKKVAEYADKQNAKPAADACLIDDADLRFRDSLRRNRPPRR